MIFRPVVRLSLRTFPAWLVDHWNDIAWGIKNIIRWTPVIWFDEDFDWSNLARVMEFKLRLMEKEFRVNGHHVNSKRDAKQVLICAELLNRMQKEDYYDNADSIYPERNGLWVKHIAMQEKQGQEYLALMFRKYLRAWWD